MVGNYDIEFDVASLAVCGVAMLCLFLSKDMTRQANKIYFLLLTAAVGSGIFGIAYAVMDLTPGVYSNASIYAVNYFYLLIHNLTPLLFYFYVLSVTGIRLIDNRATLLLTMIPEILTLILFAVQLFVPCIFYIDATGTYHRDFMMYWLYTNTFLYAVFVIAHIIRFRKAFSKKKLLFFVLFIFGSAFAVVFSFFFPYILLELFLESVAYFSALVAIEDQAEIIDPASHLYNRRMFNEDIGLWFNAGVHFDLFLIKICNVSSIMDAVGLQTVFNALDDVGRRMRSIDSAASVYYLDSGRFAVMMQGKNQNRIDGVKNRLIGMAKEDWKYQELSIPFQAVIYHLCAPEDVHGMEDIANVITREENLATERQYALYEGDGLKDLRYEADVVAALERALEDHSFKVYYQPIWDASTGKIHSAEALLRLFDPEIGFVPPDIFIRIAEQRGYIRRIGEYVFEEVCKFIAEAHPEKLGIRFIEVNLSPVQCMMPDLPERFQAILEKYHVPAEMINLEITETAAAENAERMAECMRRLSELGFTFSMDDYGTGYSNIQGIFRLNFDIIKIDKSILWNTEKIENGSVILESTILMIRGMNRQIVVEGVETEEQKNRLVELGVDYLQGFYFSKPVPKDAFLSYVFSSNLSPEELGQSAN